jgi:hypothetical protein
MQTPEGGHKLSGLPAAQRPRLRRRVRLQRRLRLGQPVRVLRQPGHDHFIGRNDFVNPVFSDPTWGVSDQDMFDRGNEELAKHDGKKPFYALLQTLSNHTPYALPKACRSRRSPVKAAWTST